MTHDWTNSRLRQNSLAVQCRYCRAPIGEQCITTDKQPLEAYPAHTVRLFDARKARG